MSPRKRKPLKNSRSRAEKLPASRWVPDPAAPPSTFQMRRSAINMDARDGTYRIDALAHDLIKRRIFQSADTVRMVRALIDVSGSSSVDAARRELIDWPRATAIAKRFDASLSRVAHALKSVPDEVGEIAIAVARDTGATSDDELKRPEQAIDAAKEQLASVLEGLKTLSERIDAYQSRYSAAPTAPVATNYDPLARWFVEFVAMGWHSETGKWPSGASRRHFVRLLAAGWEDVGFQTEDSKGNPRGSLETWFSERLAKRKLVGQDW